MALRAGLAVLGSMMAIAAAAEPITVVIAVEGAAPVSAIVHVESAGSSAAAPARYEVQAPGTLHLDLTTAASSTWRLRVEAPGFWAPPQTLLPAATRTVDLRLVPTGTLAARFIVPAGLQAPAAVIVRFQAAPKAGTPLGQPFEGSRECPIVEGAWRCEIPAGRFDLRLRAHGFASLYRWERSVERGTLLDLGGLALQPGASVVGWVQTRGDAAVSPQAQATLAPRLAGLSPNERDTDRLPARALTAEVDERGFFHLTGVPPGHYTLTATRAGFAPARSATVEVLSGLETVLADPLVLFPPANLKVHLTPAASPFGERWSLRLLRQDEVPGRRETAAEGKAAEDGSWAARGLAPGRYELTVEDAAGTRWVSREIDLDEEPSPVEIELPLIEVSGRAAIGRAPLAATLWLSDSARRRIRFDSDAEGRFAGWLPAEGRYQVRVEAHSEALRLSAGEVEVQRRPGRRVAEVEVTLPDTRLRGRVVDEAGRAVGGAALVAMSIETRRAPHQGSSDAEGNFAFRGLPAGRLALSARFEDRESGWHEVALDEGHDGPEVQLTLRRGTVVRGRVVGAGTGVPGARLLPLPDIGPLPVVTAQPVATDATGSFELRLNPGTSGATLLVMAPGYALRFVRLLAGTVPDPLEIAVEAHGGSLILDLPTAATAAGEPRPPQPVLLRDGIPVPPQLLATWAGFQGRAQEDPARLEVPQVEAGEYSLCPGRVARAPGGAGADCARGYLAPGGELRLRVP